MPRRPSPKIGQGAIIAIPLGDGRWVLSQVYRPRISFFLLVFDRLSDSLELHPLTARPVLGSWTNDAEVYRGNWKLLGHASVTPGLFIEPEYAVDRRRADGGVFRWRKVALAQERR